jgi:AraC-like DNA-binding protein
MMHIFQASEMLQDFIESYYLVELSESSGTEGFEQKPISNGCVEMYIGFHGFIGTCYTNTGNILNTGSAIVGAHNLKNTVKGLDKETTPKNCKFASIQFKPHGFYSIFKIPSAELYNNFFESAQVIGTDIDQLIDQLDDSKDYNERKTLLDLFFIQQLNKNSHKHYNIRAGFDIASLIRHCKGNIRTEQLKSEFKVTERTLQRDMKTALGLTPKEYCKIIRLNRLFDYINKQQKVNWFDMVLKFGYYDQAHLIHEFKSATGLTPEVFMKYKNKSLFKVENHLVIFKPTVLNNEVFEAITGIDNLQYTE